MAEQKFRYLDLRPNQFADSKGIIRTKTALHRWGPTKCFQERDLYKTRFGPWESTEIEEKFFGRVDDRSPAAVEYFATFQHPSANSRAFHAFLPFASIQKLRTPKGLIELAKLTGTWERNALLQEMQRLQRLYCAIWSECIWALVDAHNSETKFILSDHPITVYNRLCPPPTEWRPKTLFPDIRYVGSHTFIPLSIDRMLILTNLSWVRNPFQRPDKWRPNPNFLRNSFFHFLSIQTGRSLREDEVNTINYVVKSSAHRYIAAAKEEWLYPENKIKALAWNQLDRHFVLMPDPREVSFSAEIIFGYEKGPSDIYDEYGRRPDERGFKDEKLREKEWGTFAKFRSEYARLFGPGLRGAHHEFGEQQKEYSKEYHESLVRRTKRDLRPRSQRWPKELRTPRNKVL
jgi:hypothetical protein